MNDGAGKLNMNFGASGLSTLKTEEEEAFLCLPAAIAIERARGAFRGEGGRLPAMTAEFSTTVEGVRQQWNWDGRTDRARGQRNNLADKNVNAKSRRPWKSLCGQSGGNWRYALATDEEEMRCGGGGGRMDGVEKSVKNERTNSCSSSLLSLLLLLVLRAIVSLILPRFHRALPRSLPFPPSIILGLNYSRRVKVERLKKMEEAWWLLRPLRGDCGD